MRRSILHTLRVRYTLDMIYTYSGNILIAVRAALTGSAHRPALAACDTNGACSALAPLGYLMPLHATAVCRLRARGLPNAHVQHPSHQPPVTSYELKLPRCPQANPHKRLRHLYGARMMTQYRGVPLGELSPHVYAIAEQVQPGLHRLGVCQQRFSSSCCALAVQQLHSRALPISYKHEGGYKLTTLPSGH